jgi:hypothetical protein
LSLRIASSITEPNYDKQRDPFFAKSQLSFSQASAFGGKDSKKQLNRSVLVYKGIELFETSSAVPRNHASLILRPKPGGE